MNIFILDEDPMIAAYYHCDKHIVKMIPESCQMLANKWSLEELQEAPPTASGASRVHSYMHHPCSKWVIETDGNYNWLLRLTEGLLIEYIRRYKRAHFCTSFYLWCLMKFRRYQQTEEIDARHTPFALAMPDEYKCSDAVRAYRSYYIHEKASFARWKDGNMPRWFKHGLNMNYGILGKVINDEKNN